MKKLCIIMLVFGLIQLAEASGDFLKLDWNITGSGARATGMGGAFIGVADDATAINWNPGGLTTLEHFEASYVGSFTEESEDFDYEFKLRTYDISTGWDEYSDSYNENLSYSSFSYLNFLSIVYPMTIKEKKFVIAASIQKQLDFFSEDKWEDNEEEGESNSEGGVYTANLGASYQITPSFSAGLTTNFWMGNAEYEGYDIEKSSSDEYSFSESLENFKGFNLILGTMFDWSFINEKIPLRIGAVVKTPFDLTLDYSYEDYFNGILDDDGESEITFEIPLMFGIGASYRFGDYFTVAVDYERRNYGNTKVKFDNEYFPDDMPFCQSEEDLNQIRIGMEYLIVTDNYVLPIRFGAYNYPTLLSNYEYNYNYFEDDFNWSETETNDYEQVVGYGLSFGSGLIFEKFAIDFSYNFLTYETTETYTEEYIWDYSDDNLDWTEEWTDSFTTTNVKHTINFSAILYLD